MSIVRGLDVGFGSTKFVVGRSSGHLPECRLFPSLAPLSSGTDISSGVLKKRDTLTVVVDGKHYEVWPQAEHALKTHNARVLHSDYVRTPEYLALARGAMTYMNVPHIDVLVVGLPVAEMATKSEVLEQRMVGPHVLPNGRVVSVRRVITLAQPVGGFVSYTTHAGNHSLARQQTNLVIDPGFFTFDWVLAKGFTPVSDRSGSFNGGVSAVLRRIAAAIGRKHGIAYDDLNAIDIGLQTGDFRLYGRPEPLSGYIFDALPAIEEAVTAMHNVLGDGRDIDNIVLSGGGASLFQSAIVRRFPNHEVHLVEEAVFANVRGFQYVGEEVMRRAMGNAA
jgi:plasmid segregation protein ParM